MESRTFQAREIKEALALVRRELGPEAVILGTRKVPGRALGLLGGSFVEVTAAGPDTPPPHQPQPRPRPAQTSTGAHSSPPARRPAATTRGEKPWADARGSTDSLLPQQRARRAARIPKPAVRDLIRENPKAAVVAVASRGGVAPHATLRRRLLAAMVPRDLCEQWLTTIPDLGSTPRSRGAEEAELRRRLHQLLGPAAPLCREASRVAALIGPTGVGKTTTIAKLAAAGALVEGRQVALVSLDDQRIGATNQLRAYADLLGLPMVTATSAGGLAQALAGLREADLVLVDTAGISPSRPEEFDALARRLERAGEPITSHLCVAASTRNEELERILHLYGPACPSAILPTKLDEAVAVGTVFAARFRQDIPLSFATTGQQVPEDIQAAQPDFLVDLLLGDPCA